MNKAAITPILPLSKVKAMFKIIEKRIVLEARGFLPIASMLLGIDLEKVMKPIKNVIRIIILAPI